MFEKNVEQIARAREIEAEALAKLADLKAEIENEYGHALERLSSKVSEAKQNLADAEGVLRSLAVENFNSTGEKKPNAAVTIKEFSVLEYDPDTAIDWCIASNMKNALKLDKRKFETLAKAAIMSFLFVFDVEPRAQIATDLSDWLI